MDDRIYATLLTIKSKTSHNNSVVNFLHSEAKDQSFSNAVQYHTSGDSSCPDEKDQIRQYFSTGCVMHGSKRVEELYRSLGDRTWKAHPPSVRHSGTSLKNYVISEYLGGAHSAAEFLQLFTLHARGEVEFILATNCATEDCCPQKRTGKADNGNKKKLPVA